jgi:toxin-antitoxin system PIN domain toxin
MFVVDTNVLVHAVDDGSPFHLPCRDALMRWRRSSSRWFTTWSVLYEFTRVVSHPGIARLGQPASQAWRFVEELLACPGLSLLVETERHAAMVADLLREVPAVAGNLVHDAHIAILMREHGVRRIYTRDAAFRRFPFLEPIDPVAEAAGGALHERTARYRGASRRRVRG